MKPIDNKTIGKVLTIVRDEVKKHPLPIVTLVAQTEGDPFKVLISTMLSLRTKDQVTAEATHRILAKAPTPQAILRLTENDISKLIYPVGFYRTKAKAMKETCQMIVEEHGGKVPDDIDTLVTFPGVGRKTANLVLTLGFRKHAMCVDTHVHRISNRWGYVRTKVPKETEFALREKLPRQYWLEYNDLLVTFGQHLCRPISPMCSRCQVKKYCARVGVGISR
ncbi:TPA: endonuclease III [Candidatus Woesearchaeota archaeon]|nr:endonuclease III [Candidatus Woesearchaeota archaeon]